MEINARTVTQRKLPSVDVAQLQIVNAHHQEVHRQDRERRNVSSTKRMDRAVGTTVRTNVLTLLHPPRESQRRKPRRKPRARQRPNLSRKGRPRHFRQLRLFNFVEHGILWLQPSRSGALLMMMMCQTAHHWTAMQIQTVQPMMRWSKSHHRLKDGRGGHSPLPLKPERR